MHVSTIPVLHRSQYFNFLSNAETLLEFLRLSHRHSSSLTKHKRRNKRTKYQWRISMPMYPLKPCWIDCWKSGKNAQENGLSQPALNQWDNSLTITHPLWDKEQVVSLQGAQSMGGCGWREMRTYYGFFWCHSKMKRMTWFLILNTAQVKFGSACAILSWWTANSSFAWKTSWRKLSLLACSSFRKDFHVELI